jgi:16S rRNA (guanine527-N7)-methyltransferase
VNPEELWLYSLCKNNGIYITDIQIRLLSQYKTHLLDWNKKINLISRKNEENLWKGHIALSLTLLFKIEFHTELKILDLGTGGGFPGIPLAIMLPETSFLLLDSTKKKIIAVQSMVESLSLPNIKTIWGRAEELQRNQKFHQSFDIIVARSVSSLPNLLEWGLPFLKPSSKFNNSIKVQSSERSIIQNPSIITFKGGEIEAEETTAKKKFPTVKLDTIPLIFHGSEEFENHDKKLVIATL